MCGEPGTGIFIDKIERLLWTAAGPTRDGERPSAARGDDACVFRAVLLMPGGIGAALNAKECNEHLPCSFGEQVDLRGQFLAYGKLLAVVRAMLVKNVNHMVSSLFRNVRLIDS